MDSSDRVAAAFAINRIGLGALRLQATENDSALTLGARGSVRLLRRAHDLGYRFIDTASAYGPFVNEAVVGKAFEKIEDVVIATKGGFDRARDGAWRIDARPETLVASCEASLRRLRREQIDLYQLHAVDPNVPLSESIGALVELRGRGDIAEIGVCNVSAAEVAAALEHARIATVQNHFSALSPPPTDLIDLVEDSNLFLISWFPLEAGGLARRRRQVTELAARKGLTVAQLMLCALLRLSRSVVAIPGTRDVRHLEENLQVGLLDLADYRSELDSLTTLMARRRAVRARRI